MDALTYNSEGSYLYARTVLEDVITGLPWEEVPRLPRGFDLLYNNFFRNHLFESNSDDGRNGPEREGSKPALRAVKPVLEVLLAATKHGVTEREIAHSVVAGGACDPSAVSFCLRDIQWALDTDSSGKLPRYSLRHESISILAERRGKSACIWIAGTTRTCPTRCLATAALLAAASFALDVATGWKDHGIFVV